jgi:hypothetical protein
MTILNQTLEQIQIGDTYNFASPLFIIIMGIAFIFCLFIILFCAWNEDLRFGIVMGMLSFLIIGIIGLCAAKEPIYKDIPQYEVTINEDANFYDILDNYDIIEQHGKIFILRDKNWEDDT